MKKLIFILFLLALSVNGQQVSPSVSKDPFAPFPEYASAKKPKPPVPEPATYGAVFMIISFGILGIRKWRNNKS